MIPQVTSTSNFREKIHFLTIWKEIFILCYFFRIFWKFNNCWPLDNICWPYDALKNIMKNPLFEKWFFFEFSNSKISQLTSKKSIFASFWAKRLRDSANRISFSWAIHWYACRAPEITWRAPNWNFHAFFDIFLPKSMKNKHSEKDSNYSAHWMILGAHHASQWIAYGKEIRFALSPSFLAQKLAKIDFLEVSCEIFEFENSKKLNSFFKKSIFHDDF